MKKFPILVCALLLAANAGLILQAPESKTPNLPIASADRPLSVRKQSFPILEAAAQAEGPKAQTASRKLVRKKAGPSAELSQNESQPGETIFLTLHQIQDASSVKVANPFGFNVRFTPIDEDTVIGFLPISYFTVPGEYAITVTGGGLPQGGVSFSVKVNDKQFEQQRLTVKEEVADSTIFNDDASKEYRSKIWPMKDVYDDARYFDGRFIPPLEGDPLVTTQFGMLRTVNGKPNPRHDGIDFSAATGTPIRAAQNGRVLFADFVKLTGNTVIIEHGCGLKSWYQHLDTLDVEAGAMVKAGEQIGAVGSTGFSTGPHLHFSASVNNVFVNPFTLLDTGLLDLAAGAQAGEDLSE